MLLGSSFSQLEGLNSVLVHEGRHDLGLELVVQLSYLHLNVGDLAVHRSQIQFEFVEGLDNVGVLIELLTLESGLGVLKELVQRGELLEVLMVLHLNSLREVPQFSVGDVAKLHTGEPLYV